MAYQISFLSQTQTTSKIQSKIFRLHQAKETPDNLIQQLKSNKKSNNLLFSCPKNSEQKGLVQSQTKNKPRNANSNKLQTNKSSIWGNSQYVPISSHEFRHRLKEKQLGYKERVGNKMKTNQEYKKKHRNIILKVQQSETNQSHNRKRSPSIKLYEDHRSQISFNEDGKSLRYSAYQNIEKEAREYEKKQEIVERKQHFKKLVTLSQSLNDQRAKQQIDRLLTKYGVFKKKVKTQKQQIEIDQLNLIIKNQPNS